MKLKYVDAQKYAYTVMAALSVAHDQVDPHIFDIQPDFLDLEVVQLHGRVWRHKATRRYQKVPPCSKAIPSDLI